MEIKKAVCVTYLGYQERVDGTSFLLVNEVDTHSTVTFDPKKHVIIEKEI